MVKTKIQIFYKQLIIKSTI